MTQFPGHITCTPVQVDPSSWLNSSTTSKILGCILPAFRMSHTFSLATCEFHAICQHFRFVIGITVQNSNRKSPSTFDELNTSSHVSRVIPNSNIKFNMKLRPVRAEQLNISFPYWLEMCELTGTEHHKSTINSLFS